MKKLPQRQIGIFSAGAGYAPIIYEDLRHFAPGRFIPLQGPLFSMTLCGRSDGAGDRKPRYRPIIFSSAKEAFS